MRASPGRLQNGTTQTRFIWVRDQLCTLRANLGCSGESLRAARDEKMMEAKLC